MKILLSSLSIFLIGAVSSLAQSPIKVVGSDLLEPLISSIAKEHLSRTGQSCKIEMTGSLNAENAMKNGNADIAIIATLDGNQVKNFNYSTFPFAYIATSVAVNADNPIQEISLDQLINVYSSSENSAISEWGQLGLSGAWKERKVEPFVNGNRDSLALRLFEFTALKGTTLKAQIATAQDKSSLLESVAKQETAIAIVRAPAAFPGVRAIPISSNNSDGQQSSTEASSESLIRGDYPFKLSFTVCYNPSKRAAIKAFLRKLFESPTPAMLEKNGFVPLPQRELERIVLELDIGN